MPASLAVVIALMLIQPLGVEAQRGGSGEVGPAVWRVVSNPAERRAWELLSRAPHHEKPEAAAGFLESFPDSPLAALAHFQLSTRAFEDQDYLLFVAHGEAALAGFPKILELAPEQKIRWLQLLSQLAFYYAETGDIRAPARASSLMQGLKAGSRPPTLGAAQWEQYRRHSLAAAHYASGRAALSRAVNDSSNGGKPGESLRTAITELEESIRLNPADGYAAFRLGSAYEMSGNLPEAGQRYARAAAVPGPAAQPARQQLENVLNRLGQPGQLAATLAAGRSWVESQLAAAPRALLVSEGVGPHPLFWWDAVPEAVKTGSVKAPFSNIAFQDYAGPEACRTCHQDKYDAWRGHSHSRMNAWAGSDTVRGDFSGQAKIRYQGGEAAFVTRDGAFQMRLQRGNLKRVYQVVRTIGSRFFQYYVGLQIEGPEARDHPVYQVDHVLPFGYWLDREEWVPVVHINEELPDEERIDLFSEPSRVAYDRSCSPCHTTRPFGDWLMTTDGRLRSGAFSPREFSFDLWGYLNRTHRELLPADGRPLDFPISAVQQLLDQQANVLPAKDYAVVLGVSCEACHNGAAEHVRQSEERVTRQRPLFFPAGPEIYIPASEAADPARLWGRKPENLKWICGRCHSGGRPQFAAGIDTWNSTEFSDAVRGACYTGTTEEGFGPLTCTHCHDPHHTIGKAWSRSPRLDDAKCLACHPGLRPAEARRRHTLHPAGSEGDRCLNCHMPRLNEGLQETVRTHHIFSPTEPSMLEANQPNACNLCHLDKSLQWTLDHLRTGYGKTYDLDRIRQTAPSLDAPAAIGWLQSPHEPTRLAALEALGRANARWAIPQLIEMLDDPYMINRQFTQKRLEEMLGVRLKDYGYQFYQSRKQRAKSIKTVKKVLSAEYGQD